MKKIIVPFLLIFTICLFLTIVLVKPFLSPSAAPDTSVNLDYRYWIIISTYICVIFTFLLNRENLALYNIDKLSLLILAFAGGIRVYLHTPNEVLFKNIVLILSAILFCLTLTNWGRIPDTHINWLLTGISTCILVIPLAYVESFQTNLYSVSNELYEDHFVLYAIKNVLHNLVFVAPIEEFLLRSILWGELRKRQYGEEKIFWIQGLLFFGMHFWKVFTPITFFISLPISIFVESLLVKYSKQISPSIISHWLLDSLVPMFVYFISVVS